MQASAIQPARKNGTPHPMRRPRTHRLLVISMALALAAPTAFAADRNIDKVNGSITVDAGERYGNLETVNGSIKIGENARIANAETVNGSIRVADNVHSGGLSTVNGGIRVGTNATVNNDVSTVNGGIFVDRGGNIRGNVETVNGAIGLIDTDVSGGIQTVKGDVTVGAGSHVRGGIHYEKPGMPWISFGKQAPPRVVIGPQARVDGALVFEREVVLYVHGTARIGPVTGAEILRYDGPAPPAR